MVFVLMPIVSLPAFQREHKTSLMLLEFIHHKAQTAPVLLRVLPHLQASSSSRCQFKSN